MLTKVKGRTPFQQPERSAERERDGRRIEIWEKEREGLEEEVGGDKKKTKNEKKS